MYESFQDIPKFTTDGNYRVDVPWDHLEMWIARQDNKGDDLAGLDMDPDYQREHVWTEEQQIAYVEFCLRGGRGSSEIRWNCSTWMKSFTTPVELVDGKQRLEAVRKFLRDELPAFGKTGAQYSGVLDMLRGCSFSFIVNDLQTRAEVLQWYLDINTGGTPHTDDEIARVRALLEDEV